VANRALGALLLGALCTITELSSSHHSEYRHQLPCTVQAPAVMLQYHVGFYFLAVIDSTAGWV